jgi:hypothetical protein
MGLKGSRGAAGAHADDAEIERHLRRLDKVEDELRGAMEHLGDVERGRERADSAHASRITKVEGLVDALGRSSATSRTELRAGLLSEARAAAERSDELARSGLGDFELKLAEQREQTARDIAALKQALRDADEEKKAEDDARIREARSLAEEALAASSAGAARKSDLLRSSDELLREDLRETVRRELEAESARRDEAISRLAEALAESTRVTLEEAKCSAEITASAVVGEALKTLVDEVARRTEACRVENESANANCIRAVNDSAAANRGALLRHTGWTRSELVALHGAEDSVRLLDAIEAGFADVDENGDGVLTVKEYLARKLIRRRQRCGGAEDGDNGEAVRDDAIRGVDSQQAPAALSSSAVSESRSPSVSERDSDDRSGAHPPRRPASKTDRKDSAASSSSCGEGSAEGDPHVPDGEPRNRPTGRKRGRKDSRRRIATPGATAGGVQNGTASVGWGD